MIERIARALQPSGSALHRYPLELAGASFAELRQIIHIEIYIIGHEEIELAIVVIIDESGAGRPTRIADASFLRNVAEGAVAIVSEQMVWSQAGHVDIVPAIVIVIANRYSHPPSDVTDPGLVRYLGKRSVAVVVIKSAPRLLLRFHHVHRQRIHQVDVQVTIVVVIKERHSPTH